MSRFRFPWRNARSIRDDVDDELRFHLEARRDELVATGLSSHAARSQALQEFGDVNDARDYMRSIDHRTENERRRRRTFSDLAQDARYAWRALRTTPLYTLTAIITLALGIGANVAIFSVVHGVLLRPLPYPHPEQLHRVWAANRTDDVSNSPVSAVDIDDWRAARRSIADLGGWFYQDNMGSGVDLTGTGEPQRLSAVYVTDGFFTTLGTSPLAGRLPRHEELVRGGPNKVAMLTYGFWQRHFGGASTAVGAKLTLDGQPYQVSGILPASFAFPAPGIDVYLPYDVIPDEAIPRIRPVRIMGVVARAKPGVTTAGAQAELNGIARRLAGQYPENAQWDAVTVTPLRDAMSGKMRTPLLVLTGAVGFVLLIACVNVASLALARAVARAREIALRAALGAGRGRIVRQLLTESVVLSIVGGAAGLFVAWALLAVIRAQGADQIPRAAEVGLHAPVLLFALGLSIVTGLLFGLVPAMRLSSSRLQATLRSGGRGLAGGDGQRLRDGLVIAEVALALVLAVSAGLMARSFRALMDVDPGFRAERLLAVTVSISPARHGSRFADFGHRVIEAVRAVPGVVNAAAVKDAPFRGQGESAKLPLPGGRSDSASVAILHISDGYFRTLGTPVLEGREFTAQDDSASPFAYIVNEAFVRKYFPGQHLVGRTIGYGRGAPVLGVVGNIRQTSMDTPATPTVYINYRQNGRSRHTLMIRTRGEPAAMVRQVQQAVWALDKDQTFGAVFTLDDAIGESVARPRLLLVLLGGFGVLGLGLGALGIYGVLAYLVSQRPREIGVRLALGAAPRSVSGMIVRRGLALTSIGLLIGVAAALALGRVLSGVLYGIAPTDPATFGGVTLVLLGVAALGSWLPARRAAGVDPAVTLRGE